MGSILDGMRVVEGSAFVAAPLGGMTLAQLGADVIRFDPIGGGLDARRWPVTADGKSLFWAGLNKGKRSVAIDLRSPRGRELVTDLITAPGADAGLFLTNFPATGWLDFAKLTTRRPDLVMVNIVGNFDGTSAVDYTVNPATGFPWATGPVNLGVYGNYLYGAFGRDFATKEGKRIMVVGLTKRQWHNLVEATGINDAILQIEKLLGVNLDHEGDRFVAREVIGAILKPWIISRTLDEVREIFDAHEVCWAPYQTFTELVENDPRCSTQNPMFAEVEQPGIGTYLMPGTPLVFSRSERMPPTRAPVLGEHTDEVLHTILGLSEAAIGRLHDEGVVAGP
jgi:2-methylfumaryl-CoA isomerase